MSRGTATDTRPKPADAWFVDERVYTSYPIHRHEQIEKDGEAHVWLVAELRFVVEFNTGIRNKYTIKQGYHSDGASKPFWAHWLVGPRIGSDDEPAAFAHDILCESRVMNSVDAGEVFKLLMDHIGVSWWKRRIMWRTVRHLCQPIQDGYPNAVVEFANEHLEVERV